MTNVIESVLTGDISWRYLQLDTQSIKNQDIKAAQSCHVKDDSRCDGKAHIRKGDEILMQDIVQGDLYE